MKYFDIVIEKGLIFIILFTPLAVGTTQLWSAAIMEMAAFIIFGAWLLKQACLEKREDSTKNWLIIFPVAMIFIAVIQIIPLPEGLLKLISPSANQIYKTFSNDLAGAWRTISICPDATTGELFKLISYTAVFFIIVNHYTTKAQINSLVRAIIYMGCFLVVFTVFQKMTWNGRLFWLYPLKKGIDPFGPYINHNHFAGYLEMAIPLAMGLLLYNTSKINIPSCVPLTKKIAFFLNSSNLLPMTLMSLVVLVMSCGLFFSLSRGGVIGLALSVIFFMLIIRTKRSLRVKGSIFILLGGVVVFIVAISIWSRIEDRFEQAVEGEIDRIDVWKDTVRMVRDFPATGTGLGTFKNIYFHYQTKHDCMYEHAHNDYVEILTDTGPAGFMIVILMTLSFFLNIIKAWKGRHNRFVQCLVAGGLSSCIAIAAHSITDFNMRIPANAMLLTIIAGATYSTVHNVRERRADGSI